MAGLSVFRMAPPRKSHVKKKSTKKRKVIQANVFQGYDFSEGSMVAKVHTRVKGPLPLELLEPIFMQLDRLSQHTFGVANHHFRSIFLEKYEESYGKPYGYIEHIPGWPSERFIPVRMMDEFVEPGKYLFRFRHMMRSWIPANHIWDPNSGKYLGVQLKKAASETLLEQAADEHDEEINNEVEREEEWENNNAAYETFQEERQASYKLLRDEHKEFLMQNHAESMEQYPEENESDEEYDGDGYPFDHHLDEVFQAEEVPEDFVDGELEEVDEPSDWVEFEDPDDAPLCAEDDSDANIEMTDLE